ncbi:hypothetical protein EUX98_g9318 [Antrodiella citrinella]|uniref:WLM domain-containing protein n=1 Tax=Antrodiella citrinella TaxID=2447956 RepID=A0A4S4LUZ3_9APHY|nr:hypothetical protein EUX98_g9318 [Antrodiella citrinella]
MVSTNDITINVSYRGSTYPISVPSSSLLADLQASIEDLTGVPVSHQKLLYKGKKTSRRPTSEDEEERTETVEGAGLKDGLKVMLVGGTKEEVGTVQREEQKAKQRETIERERRAKPQAKFPSPEALNVLRRLADDPAIRHVMQTHRFAVGVLTEFAPHEHPDKLGYNTNAGQSISLRIRTDLYDGFRPYLDVRKVLLHELTHNVWGDHDNNFKELNSQLNREVLEYERTLKANTHTLSETDPAFSSVYDSSSDLREATSFVLGGPGTGMPASRDEGVAERRRRVLEATMARLRKEEEELEGACGTDAAQSSSTGTL